MEALLREIQASGAADSLPKTANGDPDLSSMGSEAQEIWKLLDRLAESDPEGYKKFVEQQVAAMKQGGSSATSTTPEVIPTHGLCILVQVTSRRKREEGVIRPTTLQRPDAPAECISGHYLYINLCTHTGITSPKDAKGQNVLDLEKGTTTTTPSSSTSSSSSSGRLLTTTELLSLEIPMAVGDMRRLPREVKGQSVWAVDVLVHPWVISSTQRDATFKKGLLTFVTSVTGEEVGLNFDLNTLQQQSAAYLGGSRKAATGPGVPVGAEVPLPFNTQRLSMAPPDSVASGGEKKGQQKKKSKQDEVEEDLAAKLMGLKGRISSSSATTTHTTSSGGVGKGAGAAGAKDDTLASPLTLLKGLRESEISSKGSETNMTTKTKKITALDDGDEQQQNEPPTSVFSEGLRIKGLDIAALGNTAETDKKKGGGKGDDSPHHHQKEEAGKFAQFAASLFPEEHLVYKGACRFTMEVNNNNDNNSSSSSSSATASTAKIATIKLLFDPALVDVAALQLADAELDIAPTSISFRVPRRLLPSYSGLGVEQVPLLLQQLPSRVDADGAKAKLNRKTATLTITISVE